MERPKFLNTITVYDTRRKYKENLQALSNTMDLVSSGTIREVFSGDNEWVFNRAMAETILQQQYIRERERANWGWNRNIIDFSKHESCILQRGKDDGL